MSKGFIVRRGSKESGPLVIEAGLIVAYYGLDTELPLGWALCNGTVVSGQQTPDLRNFFIVGAGDTYTVEQTGGNANAIIPTHTHTGSLNTVASHTHTRNIREFTQNGSLLAGNNTGVGSIGTSSSGSHSHSFTISNTGTSATNANLPPYYSLFYIIKLEEA